MKGRRVDWLRELHGLLLAAVVVSAVVGVGVGVAILSGRPFDVRVPSGDVLRADALVGVRSGVAVHADAAVYLRVEHPSGAQRWLELVATLPFYVLTTAMLGMLWRLVGDARRTDPFTGVTARRLRMLGWVLIVGGPAAAAIEVLARFVLSDTVSTRGAHATLDLGTPALWFLAGFGLLAIGEVVRRGQVLRTELDGVV